MKPHYSSLEPLEPRIAPASVTIIGQDGDGDIVKIVIKGPGDFTTADTANIISKDAAGNIVKIDLTNPKFNHADISVNATPDPTTKMGDGFVNVGQIDATGNDLGKVTIKGDLQSINAGDAKTGDGAIKSLDVKSMGDSNVLPPSTVSTLVGGLGSLKVHGNVKTEINVTGGADGKISTVNIEGSLIGGATAKSGSITTSGNLGSVIVFGVTGGTGDDSGSITVGGSAKVLELGPLTGGKGTGSGSVLVSGGGIDSIVVSSISGGTGAPVGAGTLSGTITAQTDIGKVKVDGSIFGGDKTSNGSIFAGGKLGTVTVSGGVKGSTGQNSGQIHAGGEIDSVTVANDLTGGTGASSGQITGASVKTGITINGNVTGGAGDNSGSVKSGGNTGKVKIGGSVKGGGGMHSGELSMDGKVGGVFIGGNLEGGGAFDAGTVVTSMPIPSCVILGDVIGGSATATGSVQCDTDIALCTIGGNLVGGSGNQSGEVGCAGTLGTCTIGGSLIGGDNHTGATLMEAGAVHAGRIMKIGVGHDLVAGQNLGGGKEEACGAIVADNDIGTCTISGDCVGNDTNTAKIIGGHGLTKDFVFTKITVGHSLMRTQILAGYNVHGKLINCDTQIGAISVGLDSVESDIVSGVDAGMDGVFGTADDSTVPAGVGVINNPALFSTIASITVRGQFFGNNVGASHYGVVAAQIGKIVTGGRTYVLDPHPLTDLFRLSGTGMSNGDYFAREDVGT